MRREYRKGTPEERFIARLDKVASGCWEWRGYRFKGYGKFGLSPNKSVLAHRFAYELWVGQIPEGALVHHVCENKACCRPDHLDIRLSVGEHTLGHVYERGWVRNQYGEEWPVARTAEERRIRDRDWMRAKRAASNGC